MLKLDDVRTLSGGEAMGGKKIGTSDAQGAGCPAAAYVSGVSRLVNTAGAATTTTTTTTTTSGSAGKASVGYAGIVKMGLLRENREVLGSPQAISPSSSSVSLDTIGEGGGCEVKTNGGSNFAGVSPAGECSEPDSPLHEVDRSLDEAMKNLSVKCGEIRHGVAAADSKLGSLQAPAGERLVGENEGDGSSERSILEMVESRGSGSHSGQDQWPPTEIDLQALDVGRPLQQQPANEMEYEQHRSSSSQPERDFRPPSLILPDASNTENEFTSNGQERETVDAEYRPMKSYLPVSLVMSPHEVKNLLDPNAQEFTPSPTPCQSPSPSNIMSIVQPPSYHVDQQHPHMSYAAGPGMKIGPVMYSGDHSRAPVVPLYPNGAPLYGAMPGSQSPWDAQQLGLGMQGAELPHHHMASGSAGPIPPAPMVAQHHPPHLMGHYGPGPAVNSFISSGCSPSIGSPSGSASAFAVPPPLTGREHVSRALLLSGVPTELTDYSLRQELEQWGLVRALGLERRHEGLVTAHFYDLRHAKEALRDIQQQHLLQQQRIQQKFQKQMQRHRSPSSSSSVVGHTGGAGSSQNPESGAGSSLDLEKHSSQDSAHDLSADDDIHVDPPPARGLLGGKAVWAQYTMAGGPTGGLDSHNQGTLVVFNLDVDMPLDDLRAAFEVYGAVKELRETPAKRQHKFVEYFDVRDAARALQALDGHEIGGKRVKIEFSRPGGQARRARAQAQAQVLAAAAAVAAAQQRGGAGGSLGSMVPFVGSRMNTAAMPGAIQGQPMYLGWGADPSMGGPAVHGMEGPPGLHPQYMWTTNFQHHALAPLPALVQQQQWNATHGQQQQQLQPILYQMPMAGPGGAQGSNAAGGLIPYGAEGGGGGVPHNRHLGGREGYGGSNASGFHAGVGGFPGSRCSNNHSGGGGGGSSGGRGGCDEPSGRRRRGGGGGSGSSSGAGSSSNSNGSILRMDLPGPSSGPRDGRGSQQQQQQNSAEGSRDSPRSVRSGSAPRNSPSPREHAQYVFHADQLDLRSEIMSSARTTLMIKNIPNKYSQAMLLALLDQHCVCCNRAIVDPNEPQSSYDFVYLPIDFKNRCNLGYAFVNFTSVQATVKLYKCFHAQQWEAFNSRKVCQVTYARVQGRAALEEHFRNSRFACDTDEYLPLVFSPPRTGIICPPPIVAAGHLAGRAVIPSTRVDEGSSSRTSNHNRAIELHGTLIDPDDGRSLAAGRSGSGGSVDEGSSSVGAQGDSSTERDEDAESSDTPGGGLNGGL